MNGKHRTRIIVFTGLLVASMVIVAANGTRMLVGNDDVTASMDTSFICGDTAPVIIESGDPDVFEGESARMQSIVDTVQAVIRHECDELDRIDITGYLKGLDQSVYAGYAQWQDRWRVQVERSLKTEPSASALTGDDTHSRPPSTMRELSVASNRLDMPLEEVRSNIVTAFGADPHYDPEAGVLQLKLGGCPTGYPQGAADAVPDSRWTCVKATFTDRRIPTLYHFAYTQVVQGSVADARSALIEHFGPPHSDRSGVTDESDTLVWTGAGEGGVTTEMIEASLSRSGDDVVVTITLLDPRAGNVGAVNAPDAAPEGDSSGTEFRLKL